MNRNLPTDVIESNGNGVAADVLASGRALQQTRTSFCTAVAVQRPRSLPVVERRLLEEARLAGEDFYYGWSAGKDRIEGPSVDLAVAAARCWGNCAIESMPVQETPDSWIFTAAFIDLETGFTMDRQFRQSKKWTVHGKLDDERKDDVRFQIGQSKATRNVILKCLPKSLVNKAMETAKDGVKIRIEALVKEKGIVTATEMAIKAFARVGVKEDRLLARLGVAKREAIDVDMLVILRGDLQAIESGQEYASVLFPEPGGNGESKADALKDKMQGKKPEPAKQAEPPKQEEPSDSADGPGKRLLSDLQTRVQKLGWSEQEVREYLMDFNVVSFDQLVRDDAERIVKDLKEKMRTVGVKE